MIDYRLKNGALIIAAISCLTSPKLGSAAQEAAAQQALPAAERSDDAALSEFLAIKTAKQAKRKSALDQRGQGGDEAEIRQLFKNGRIDRPNPSSNVAPANSAALAEAFETDTVQLLQSIGLKPGRVRSLTKAGYDPVEAAAAYVRGSATLQQQALLSSAVVVARVSEVRQEDLGDGYHSTVVLDVTEAILGRYRSGKIALRQASGIDSQGRQIEVSSDLHPAPGQSYILMLSDGLYKQTALESGGKPAGGAIEYFVLFGSSYTLDGDVIEGSFPGAAPMSSLTAFKADLAQVSKQHGADLTD